MSTPTPYDVRDAICDLMNAAERGELSPTVAAGACEGVTILDAKAKEKVGDATDHRVLFDDTYTGVRHRYGCRHGRGWTWFGIPEGSIAGSGRESEEFPGGVWDYPAPIPEERAERFSMVPLGTIPARGDAVGR